MLTDKKVSAIDTLLSKLPSQDAPGYALGLILNEEIVHLQCFGMAHLEYGIPISKNSAFEIASTSKQFTAACALLLVQEGKLSLEDDIRTYLTSFPFYGEAIRISNLLHHTSGLRDYLPLRVMSGFNHEDPMTHADAVVFVSRQKSLNFQPGEQFSYSNTNYLLLAEIVQIVSGQTIQQFAQEQIFKPLGMKNTCFDDDPQSVIENRVESYHPHPDGGYRKYKSNAVYVGAAGIVTTIPDLCRWDRNFYSPVVGGEDFIRQMLTGGKLNNGKRISYAGGLSVDEYRGLQRVHHAGSLFGFRCQFARFPAHKFSIICISNLETIHPDYLVDQITDICLFEGVLNKTFPKRSNVSFPIEILKPYVGIYRSPASGRFMEIFIENEILMMEAYGEIYELTPFTETRFGIPAIGIEITFEKTENESNCKVHVHLDGSLFDSLCRIEVVQYSAIELAGYEGYYWNEETEKMIEISTHAGQFFLQRRGVLKEPLKYGVKDAFRLAKTRIEFSRNLDGKVSSLIMRGERVSELIFIKRETKF